MAPAFFVQILIKISFFLFNYYSYNKLINKIQANHPIIAYEMFLILKIYDVFFPMANLLFENISFKSNISLILS